MNNVNKKIDQYLDNRQSTNWNPIIKFIGGIIYLSGLIYAGSHVFSFISSIMTIDFLRIMAYVGGVGIVLNGAILPLAIHSWTMEKMHRMAAMFFYVLDLVLIAGFVWANTNLARGADIALVDQYMTWVSPLTFMNTILTWGVLTILDPENRLKYQLASLEQESQIIDIKTDMLLQINEAENRSSQKLLGAGLDLDKRPETRTTLTRNEPVSRPVSGEYWPRPENFLVPEEPEQPENLSFDIDDMFLEPFDQALINDYPDPDSQKNHSGKRSGTAPKV